MGARRAGQAALVAAALLIPAGARPATAQNSTQVSAPDAPTAQQGAVPDAPGARSTPAGGDIRSLAGQVAPGKSAQDEAPAPPPEPTPTGPSPDGPPQQEAPYIPKNAQEAESFTVRVPVNFVQVPVIVLDRRHEPVAGLTYRDFRIYENGQRQHISFFSVDPVPLSVAFVIDQSVPKDTMAKVNESLAALQGAFTPQDEVAVFTYANGVTEQTTFTASQGARLEAVLDRSKAPGSEMGVPQGGGPLAVQGPIINNRIVDPNLSRDTPASLQLTIPRETHTLSDAILAAGNALSTRPKGFRRVIYVISDGKDERSKASVSEVLRYLEANNETVYATMVGDAATWGLGYLDRVKLPLIPAENVLPRYTLATGGVLESEFSADGMERSFAHIAAEVRTAYTLGYYSHVPVIDGKFRNIDVHVERPNLDVIAERGYYPRATDISR